MKDSLTVDKQLCDPYTSFIVSLFAYYAVLFHVRNKDNNNNTIRTIVYTFWCG